MRLAEPAVAGAAAGGPGRAARRPRARMFAGFHDDDPGPRTGPVDQLPAEEILALLPRLPTWPAGHYGGRPARGAATILSWLLSHPGAGWQERWLAAGADSSTEWMLQVTAGDPRSERVRRTEVLQGLYFLLLGRVVLPGYGFLLLYQANGLFRATRQTWDPRLLARLERAASEHGMNHAQAADGLRAITKIVLHTGRDPSQLTAGDVRGYREWLYHAKGRADRAQFAAWDLLRGIGVIPPDLVLLEEIRLGQQTTAELVDFYQIQSRPVRDVLVRYLDERRPGLDYTSLRGLAGVLAGLFWADIESHHRGIAGLRLPAEVAEAWKQRLAFLPCMPGEPPRPRKNAIDALMTVRAFYLDIQEWALDDPSWAPWAVPSPVRKGDTAGYSKCRKEATSRMHQRVRERLPHLPVLVASAGRHRDQQAAFLAAATAVPVGEMFGHAGRTFQRVTSAVSVRDPARYAAPQAWATDTSTGDRTDVARAEDDAFWTWAVVETLRHTGVRVEELTEITHLALISYRLPGTRELVPMLQIVPSKANEERLLLVSPELATVLAAIITRLRSQNGGAVPLVTRYDNHERVTSPALPHLFQRTTGHGWRQQVISGPLIHRMLGDALARTGLTDNAGQTLRYTAHDFRRMFATEAVTGGLPVHIAARLLGHHDLSTTQAYLAVFQDDLVRAYQAFLQRRRSARPDAEYRQPTDAEWIEFQQHFELRKVELGTCGRPYGSPCNHEHACIRCPMLRLDPRQGARLAEIIQNLTDRITEARASGWAGEAEGLQVSLQAATAKLASLRRAPSPQPAGITDLGIPVIRDTTKAARPAP